MNTQGCILGHQNNKRGYQHAYVKGPTGDSSRTYNRVLWEMRFGPIPEGMIVRHMCDNPRCINHEHLQLGTVKDNTDDMMKRGRWAGGRPPMFTREQAEQIKDRIRKGESQRSIAEELGCSQGIISWIWRDKIAAYQPPPGYGKLTCK